MSHDFVLPETFRPDHPVDAKGNAGGVPICFRGGFLGIIGNRKIISTGKIRYIGINSR
ncbi:MULTISPECIES: hypothetical protein [unclassified Sphingopyxis]|uniref:hypothetical protein n=1 Tax=unclassified Sphingopyxis TaxID=2614943 RepID=UPI0012E3671E|nr:MULTISPECIES: hypothetical protein [unclassified Sphingopyxis]